MKSVKLISCIFVAALLMAVFAGCNSEPKGGQYTPAPSTGEKNDETTGTTTTKQDDEPVVSLGRMEGGVYTNQYAGFGCKLDSNWQFYTAEELQELPDNLEEMFKGTDAGDSLDKYPVIADMQAENTTDLTSINVQYQKLDTATRLVFAAYDEEGVIDETMKQKDAMISSYAQAGIDVISMEKVTVTYLGQEHTAILTSATVQSVPYYTLQIMNYHLGQYAVIVTFASFGENHTEALLDLFYPV